ncbi:MAG: Dockerin type domain, partial [Planctomycetota bacterium]
EGWDFTNWCPGEPCCFDGGLYVHASPSGCWDDHNQSETQRFGLIEWSADCNNDGIVDFGQILAGELDDANRNNIPDCCEGASSCNCPGDVARDGVVNGIDLAAVLNNWGTSGGAINADANGDGIVDAEDLALVLGSWGDCP